MTSLTNREFELFTLKFLMGKGCWTWLAYRMPSGYGRFSYKNHGGQYAHRISYEEFVGPIPDGLQIDHKCKNRGCVRPSHLEAVTAEENLRRSTAWSADAYAKRKKDHCPLGHPYSAENTYFYPDGRYKCRICSRISDNKRNALRRATK